MKIHEYQAKGLFKKYNVPVPEGNVAFSVDEAKKKLEKNTKQITKGLKEIGYEINSPTQIIPIVIGDEKRAMDFGKFLFDNGVFAQPIRYPTVPKNQARLRISVTAWLSKEDIEFVLSIFEKSSKKFKMN